MVRPLPDPLRVLLDVSHLGHVQSGPRRSIRRTGLHRVVEQTIKWVSAEPGVEVTLASARQWEPAFEYVELHPDLKALRFPIPGRKRLGSRIRQWAAAEHSRMDLRPVGALPSRMANRIAGDTNRVLDVLTHKLGRGAHATSDIFHSPLDALPAASERSRRVRYFLTVYDLIPMLFPNAVAGWNGDAWLRKIVGSLGPEDDVLAISEHTRADLLTAVPALVPERVHVTPLAADRAVFRPCTDETRLAAVRARYGLPADAPYVLTVATLAPHKNLPTLLRAFAELVRAERLGDLHLVLVGARGWGADSVTAEVGRLDELRGRVIFTGYVDDADLAPLYSGALAFAYPSLYEGFGLPPLEAMQCGTPVIASNTSSLPEVVGDAGLLVDPRDPDALAQAILDVYSDGALRADLSRRALARAQEFSWARYARETVGAYRAAI